MITILTIVALCYLGYKYYRFNYADVNSISFGSVTRLKWRQLKTFYRTNPNRWRFEKIVEEGYSTIDTSYRALLFNSGDTWSHSLYTYANADKIIRIQLSFIDYIKFIILSKTKKAYVESPGLQLIVKATQKDIKELQEEADRQIQEASKQIKEVQARMQEGVR